MRATKYPRRGESTPRRSLATATGVSWLITIVGGALALFLRGAPGVAANIVASVSYVAATLLVNRLLGRVRPNVSKLAALLGLVGVSVGLLGSFVAAPAEAGFLFFGPQCILIGYLILRSALLPGIVGFLMALGGASWLIFGLTSLLFPPVARLLSPGILLPGIVGEVVLTAWLLAKGVDASRQDGKASPDEGGATPRDPDPTRKGAR